MPEKTGTSEREAQLEAELAAVRQELSRYEKAGGVTGPSEREAELLTQLAAAKEELRITGSDEAKAAKTEIATKIRALRTSERAGRIELVGGDAVREA